MLDQDQITAAVVAGIVILTSCIGMTLSFFGYCSQNRQDLNEDDHEYSKFLGFN